MFLHGEFIYLLCIINGILHYKNGVSIFFLSTRNSCRSQMAEAILRSFDSDLEIYSAGLDPADHVSPIAIEVMKEISIDLQPVEPRHFQEFKDREFDFLITVGEGTQEELEIVQLIADGATNREIAQKLYVSSVTVKRKVQEIMEKLDASNRAQAAAEAARRGLV